MTKLLIEKIEARESDIGKKYWRVKTSDGWYSVFDFNVAKVLKEGKEYFVNIKSANGYKNIVSIDESQVQQEKPIEVKRDYNTMYVSYSKDLFIELLKQEKLKETDYMGVMAIAISLIKFAKNEFSN